MLQPGANARGMATARPKRYGGEYRFPMSLEVITHVGPFCM